MSPSPGDATKQPEEATKQPDSTSPPESASSALPSPERFARWNQELRARTPGRDVAFLDLDAIDHNVAQIRSQLGSRMALRLVSKSLPSIQLVRYLMEKAKTNRIMAFSEGMLRALLGELGDQADILLGRPMPVQGAERILTAHPHATKVRWLVDTTERLLEYSELARSRSIRVDIVIEIDVGLRRGGARSGAELVELLDVLAARPEQLHFTGLLGYDGHVPAAPPGFEAEFSNLQERYAEMVQAATVAHPALFQDNPVFNSGGSSTYERYTNDLVTPVNEVAVGSCFLLPAHFIDRATLGPKPASFLATPVLKRLQPAEIPFIPGHLPNLAKTNPDLEIAFLLLAGGFPGDIVSPQGLVINPIIPERQDLVNLLPNQPLRNGASTLPLAVGDFVFYHPWQGDALVWLDTVEVLRQDRIIDRWKTFQEGPSTGRNTAG